MWTRGIVVVHLVLANAALAEEIPVREQHQLERVASAWIKLGRLAVKKDLPDEAQRCLAGAQEAVGEDLPPVAALQALVEGCEGSAEDRTRRAFEKKAVKTRASVAKLYDALAGDGATPDARRGTYAWRALQADPDAERWERLSLALSAAYAAGARDAACSVAEEALALEPPEAQREALERLAELRAVGQVVLRRASAHPMRYYLSLPEAYDPDAERTWPVLVCVDGAGSGFEGAAKGFAKARGDLPCLVVSPCGFANTNAIEGKKREKYLRWYSAETLAEAERDRFTWDLAGLLAILDDLQAQYKAAPQVCVTGFSGGGNLTYALLFQHPSRVLAAAPACASFSRPGWGRLEHPAADLDLPIQILTGAKDPHRTYTHGNESMPGIEPQTDNAVAALEQVGFRKLKRTMLPDLGHSPARKHVVDFFRPYLDGTKQRSDP